MNSGYGMSSLGDANERKILRGRPFGGVGFLWRKELSNIIKSLQLQDVVLLYLLILVKVDLSSL